MDVEASQNTLQLADEILASLPDNMQPFWIAPGQAVYDVRKFLEVHTKIIRQYPDKPALCLPYANRLSAFITQYRDNALQYLTSQEVARLDAKTRYPKQSSYVQPSRPKTISKKR